MKTRFWFLSACSLLVINLAWVWRFDQSNTEYTQRMNENRERFVQANRELYLMNRGWEFSLKSEDNSLPAVIEVQPQTESLSRLDQYIGHSKKLILVLSDRHCSTCVDQLLFTVRNEISEPDRGNILILFSGTGQTREQWNHRQKILSGVEFLEIREKCLNLPMDSLEIPYFFLVGPENKVSMAFATYPSLEVQTKAYINQAGKLLVTN